MHDNLVIRTCNKEDIPLILKFIKSLAKYVNHLDDVVATEALLAENLFKNRYAEVIMAELAQKPIGFALFFHTFSTFLGKPGLYLEDLFIEEAYRGNGYGKKILAFLAKLAVDRDCGRLEWSVLDWDERAINFYKSLEASPLATSTVYRLTGSNLISLAKQCS